ncbi:hypothetical protein CDD82_7653 [Ophiocordyceps australis]|uniref:Right handed beta helix domain-containing protein n=1 Tax=Ophiocordyceps australis TaxID=1399860 RepID=A0A2C5YQK1_9HYPO|nr:hypothetical protein CDD82_7653 [Ophiocordyceps australis]
MVKIAIPACLWALWGTLARAEVYFVDCAELHQGNGRQESPWSSLDQVNEPVFEPGDIILFKIGSTCFGVLQPKGSGTRQAPIRVMSYGSVDDERTDEEADEAVIHGQGALATVVLLNQDHWTISNLSVTNADKEVSARQGIYVGANDGQTHYGITIESNHVHHVAGQTNKAKYAAGFIASAGILVDGTPYSRFDDVLIKGNRVTDCGGGGIKVRAGSLYSRGKNVRVTRNNIHGCGGDGIIASYSNRPLIDHNVASYLGRGAYPWTGGNFAGIWVLGNLNPVMSHNVVFGTSPSAFDSTAFDCDWGNEGVCLVEYNFSRDNAGGAFLNCDGCGLSGGANQVLRYNIFQNDCRIYSNGDLPELTVYNNVFYCPSNPFDFILPARTRFINNIFVGNDLSELPNIPGVEWLDNFFDGLERPTGNGLSGNAGFVNPGTGLGDLESLSGYMLRPKSRALGNGRVVAGNGGKDIFGNPVSPSEQPNRGAYNGPGV